jgi:NAD(P)-dependent dehydrogenase (short-subunit alcohol dehydrogenase family)
MSLALEVANKGITVNCVAPGFIETDMTGAVPPEIMQRVIEGIPMRRLGRPEEVARVVLFLAEPASGYITGQVYSINGGLNM